MSKKTEIAVEFNIHAWLCPKCRAWRRIKNVYRCGTFFRKCKCGFKVQLEITIRKRTTTYPAIIKAESIK